MAELGRCPEVIIYNSQHVALNDLSEILLVVRIRPQLRSREHGFDRRARLHGAVRVRSDGRSNAALVK